MVYDNKIVEPTRSAEHCHEEADTLIPHQVLASVEDTPFKDITVRSPDTDVLIFLLDLVSNGGKGKGRMIDILERVQVLGKPRCQALVGFHNFTGADWGGKFVGKTKESWTKAFMAVSTDDPVLESFRKLGEEIIPSDLTDGKLPAEWRPL